MKLLTIVSVVGLGLIVPGLATKFQVPNAVYTGPVTAEFQSVIGNLDGQKILPSVNDSAYDWWYFDAVSTSTNESVVFVFLETGPNGFSGSLGTSVVVVSGSFANGTAWNTAIPVLGSDVAVNVNASTSGVSAEFVNTGCSFVGESLHDANPIYTVTIHSPLVGISGTLTMRSKAPAHYPCDLNRVSKSEEIVPTIGWANAVPDADASVNMTVMGETFQWTGAGYHDKNWGVTPFETTIQSWYWGHAVLGPFSLVWFDARTPDGVEHFSAYVARDGHVLTHACDPGSVLVRPYGRNSAYPPVPTTGTPDGFTVQVDLGKEGVLKVLVEVTDVVLEEPAGGYERYIGTVKGGVEGQLQYEGRSLFEQFKFPLF